jgi:hypothetical protein
MKKLAYSWYFEKDGMCKFKSGIWNLEFGIWNLVSGIRNLEFFNLYIKIFFNFWAVKL